MSAAAIGRGVLHVLLGVREVTGGKGEGKKREWKKREGEQGLPRLYLTSGYGPDLTTSTNEKSYEMRCMFQQTGTLCTLYRSTAACEIIIIRQSVSHHKLRHVGTV